MGARRRLSARAAVGIVIMSWVVSAGLFVASQRREADAKRILHARGCRSDELFTPARCRAVADGRVVSLTHTMVRLDVAGRQLTMAVKIVGDVSHSDGTPVAVMLWRGEPIHVEGPALRADADASPITKKTNYRNASLFFLVGPPVMVGLNLLLAASRRQRPPGGYW
jgi:hypothetical protein